MTNETGKRSDFVVSKRMAAKLARADRERQYTADRAKQIAETVAAEKAARDAARGSK